MTFKESVKETIETLLSRKNELESEIKELNAKIRTKTQNVLDNLVEGEWYKIKQNGHNCYSKNKFVKLIVDDRGDNTVLHTTIQTGQTYNLYKKNIEYIFHIKGAKEAEENFLKMLEGNEL